MIKHGKRNLYKKKKQMFLWKQKLKQTGSTNEKPKRTAKN